MNDHVSLQSLRVVNDEARLRDLDLAEALGYAEPRAIRKLIQRNLTDLRRYGEVWDTVSQTSEAGGRPGTEYWLNEGQALRLCTLSNTDRAADISFEIISVYMEWRRRKIAPAAPPLPDLRDGESVQLLYAKLKAVKEARILHGHNAARALWADLGLPAPLAARADDAPAQDARACLDHLLASPHFDRDMRAPLSSYLHIVLSLEDEGAAADLAARGIRPVFEGEQGFLVANAGATLDRAYEGTRWRAMRWRYALRRLPGARAWDSAQRFGQETHRATFVPLGLVPTA